jgi:hypothetical protein
MQVCFSQFSTFSFILLGLDGDDEDIIILDENPRLGN